MWFQLVACRLQVSWLSATAHPSPTAHPAVFWTTCPATPGEEETAQLGLLAAPLINCLRWVSWTASLFYIIPGGSSLIEPWLVTFYFSLLNILLFPMDSGNLRGLLFQETVMLDLCWLMTSDLAGRSRMFQGWGGCLGLSESPGWKFPPPLEHEVVWVGSHAPSSS